MTSLWVKIKEGIKKFFQTNWELQFAYIFSYLIPILLIGEYLAFTEEVSSGMKFAMGGIIAAGFLFLILYKKIKEKVLRLPKGKLRGILRIINTAIFWGVIYGILILVDNLSIHLFDYWQKVGVCLIVGHIFFMKDEIKKASLNIHE